MDYQVFSARTKQDAITEACTRLGVTSDRLDYIVDSEGSSGFFGIGSKNAVIRARIMEEEKETVEEVPAAEEETSGKPKIKTLDEIEAKAQAAAAAAEAAGITYPEEKKEREGRRDRKGGRTRRGRNERSDRIRSPRFDEEEIVHEPSRPKPEREVPQLTDEQIEKVKTDAEKFLTDVFAAMDIGADIKTEYEKETGCLSCEFAGDEMGILIGKRGQTLDSLQYLTSLVVNRSQKDYVRVKLDTEEYRRRRKEALEILSRNIANKVKRTHARVVLEPMNPYERRIIHSTLQSNRYVETYSEGEEPYRRVVVAPKRNKY